MATRRNNRTQSRGTPTTCLWMASGRSSTAAIGTWRVNPSKFLCTAWRFCLDLLYLLRLCDAYVVGIPQVELVQYLFHDHFKIVSHLNPIKNMFVFHIFSYILKKSKKNYISQKIVNLPTVPHAAPGGRTRSGSP